MPDPLPAYDDLPMLPGLDVRVAWGVYGEGDALGSINLATPALVARAAASVTTGEVISLDLPLTLPNPPLFGRKSYEHRIFALSRNEMDDYLDGFHLQGSTQWDALNHVRCREHGYWGGRTQDPTEGNNGLGIDHWVRHGIAGRGILVDAASWLAEHEPAYDPLTPRAISVEDLIGTLSAQGVQPETGDIWCVRTGWTAAYKRLDQAARAEYAARPTFAGLSAGADMARFIWDSHPAALLCDNPAVEVAPGDPRVGSLHRRLIPGLGLALGEMFDFERLQEACSRRSRQTFFFVAAPLNVPGGLGSPGNAVAIL